MAWVEAFHIIFMVTWFAGLFYLPRLFVYHAMEDNPTTLERFKVMERKLFAIMTIGGVITAVLGLWLVFARWWGALAVAGWLHAKLALVALLIGYHLYCWHLVRAFREGRNRHGHVFYRWFNEAPALLLIAIVVLAVLKPF